MKVLHLINTFSAGGAELHLLTLCRRLKLQGVELVVACLREQVKGSRSLRQDFEKEDIKVVNLQVDSRYDWRLFSRVSHLLKEERPHILHTHLPRADLAGAFGRFLYPSVAWVCSVHAILHKCWSGEWTLPLFRSIWRRADVVVGISHAVKNWLMREQGVPRDKIRVIHYGIEPERFCRPDVSLRERWGLNGRAVIGSVGRLEQRKGYDCLIQAMPHTLAQFPDAHLLVAGHDPWEYGKQLEALIAELKLNQQVSLIGFQNDVASFLAALDVFAFASRSEGFGQVVIEAMAAGKPVVACKIPPLTEIVVDGETGLLVEPAQPEAFADAISWLLAHSDGARQMGRRGQERVKNYFSAEKMAHETLAVYNEILGTRQ